jgi:hypothetical protein
VQRAWATPLEALLVAERAALLTGRDDEFTMLVTIGYTGMRWGETIGLECDLLLPSLINLEWQLREINGRFHRLPPKDDSYRSTNVEPFVPVDILADLLTAQARARRQFACAAEHGGSGWYAFRPRRRPPPTQQLRAARLPAGVRRSAPASEGRGRQASRRGRRRMARHPGRVVAASDTPGRRLAGAHPG